MMMNFPTGAPSRRGRKFIIMTGFQDRKSTRLNSSHANISYAVFCLKKKKTQTKSTTTTLAQLYVKRHVMQIRTTEILIGVYLRGLMSRREDVNKLTAVYARRNYAGL